MNKYNIFFVSPEVSPFSKTGGLADVAGSLPKALSKLGHRVTVVTPCYRGMKEKFHLKETGIRLKVPFGKRSIDAEFIRFKDGDIEVYFLKRDEFFDRTYLYSTPLGDYFDNAERFIFFSRSVMEFIRKAEILPDIIHCHEWQTALIPVYLRTLYQKNIPRNIATVFTIHNIAFQGIFPEYIFPYTGLPKKLFNTGGKGLEFWGRVNFMKGGLLFSDALTTVSSKYSTEIQTPQLGYGLEGIVKERQDVLYGVLNGVDYNEWDPCTDGLIVAGYSAADLSGKLECKKDLLYRYNLNIPIKRPLVGMISRLSDQKGFDIFFKAVDKLMKLDIGFVVLGQGQKNYHDFLKKLEKRYRGRFGVKIIFDNTLAHRIEAGCDIFLMPSRYEPCGLNQIYSLKYGTVPVVRATGGLDDTIMDFISNPGQGTGFKIKEHSPEALIHTLKCAVDVYEDKNTWNGIVKRAMRADFSWSKSAAVYEKIYDNIYQKTARVKKLKAALQ